MSNNIGITQLVTSQANPEATANTALSRFDSFLTETLSISVAGGNAVVTTAQAQQAYRYTISGASVFGRTITLPAVKCMKLVENLATNTQNVTLVRGSGTIELTPGETALIVVDGTTNGITAMRSATLAATRDEIQDFLAAGDNIGIVRQTSPDKLVISGLSVTEIRDVVADTILSVPKLIGLTDSNSAPRAQISDDPLVFWDQIQMPLYINGSQSNWNDVVYAPELNGQLFAVAGLNGGSNKNVIAASRDGRYWSGRSDDSTAVHTGIAWSPSLGMLCAVGEAGSTTSNRIRTSTDGLIWTERALPTINMTLRCVAWSPFLGMFVAMGTSNSVFTSTDGINWTSRTGPTSGLSWRRVIWAAGTVNKFIAFDGNNIGRSSDGISWGAVINVMPGNGRGLTFDPVSSTLVVSDANSNNRIDHSTNGGTSWTTHTVTGAWHDVAWSASLGKFIAVGNRSLAHSTDGATWTLLTQSALAGSMAFTRLIATG